MIYSRSTKYAVMALIELATRNGKQPELIRDLARATELPRPFLAKLVKLLVTAGVLSSI